MGQNLKSRTLEYEEKFIMIITLQYLETGEEM